MADTPTSKTYGWAASSFPSFPRGIIAHPELSPADNVILRAGNELAAGGWSQSVHVVLVPDEASKFLAAFAAVLAGGPAEPTQPGFDRDEAAFVVASYINDLDRWPGGASADDLARGRTLADRLGVREAMEDVLYELGSPHARRAEQEAAQQD